MMSRYKPVGWRNESYRHYLAAKGIHTRRYNATWRSELDYVGAGVKPVAFIGVNKEEEPEFKSELESHRLMAIQRDIPLDRKTGEDTFLVSRPENIDKAYDAYELAILPRMSPEEEIRLGRLLGYPDEAVAEYVMRSQISQGLLEKGPQVVVEGVKYPLDRKLKGGSTMMSVVRKYMGEGREATIAAGVPEEDIAYLEFLPGSDVGEMQRAIAMRKAATRRERI